jgi:hypothetical protein
METADQNHRNPPSATSNMPTPLQMNMYSGPPPPYSYPSSAVSSVAGLAGYISPPESRRASDDDKEPPLANRQSLPSIHEALGKDKSLLYSSGPPPIVPPPPTSVPVSIHTPTTPIPRSHPEAVLSGPPNPYATTQSTQTHNYNSEPPDPRSQQAHRTGSQGEESILRSQRFVNQEPASHPGNSTMAQSPNPALRASPRMMQHQTSSPMFHPGMHHQAPVLPQPGYYGGPPAYSYPSQPVNSMPYKSQPSQRPEWRNDGLDIDRAEEMRKAALKRSPGNGQHYGESVKRHLDIFDLETSLNEVGRGFSYKNYVADSIN